MVLPPALLSGTEALTREAKLTGVPRSTPSPLLHTFVPLCVSKGGILVTGDQTTQMESKGTARES